MFPKIVTRTVYIKKVKTSIFHFPWIYKKTFPLSIMDSFSSALMKLLPSPKQIISMQVWTLMEKSWKFCKFSTNPQKFTKVGTYI